MFLCFSCTLMFSFFNICLFPAARDCRCKVCPHNYNECERVCRARPELGANGEYERLAAI